MGGVLGADTLRDQGRHGLAERMEVDPLETRVLADLPPTSFDVVDLLPEGYGSSLAALLRASGYARSGRPARRSLALHLADVGGGEASGATKIARRCSGGRRSKTPDRNIGLGDWPVLPGVSSILANGGTSGLAEQMPGGCAEGRPHGADCKGIRA